MTTVTMNNSGRSVLTVQAMQTVRSGGQNVTSPSSSGVTGLKVTAKDPSLIAVEPDPHSPNEFLLTAAAKKIGSAILTMTAINIDHAPVHGVVVIHIGPLSVDEQRAGEKAGADHIREGKKATSRGETAKGGTKTEGAADTLIGTIREAEPV